MFSNLAAIVCALGLSSISNGNDLIIGPLDKLLGIMNIPKEHLNPLFFQQSEYPPIANLNDILSPFKSCNIVLNNFRGINMKPTNWPVFLREFQLALYTNPHNFFDFHLIMVPKGISPFVNSTNNLGANCSLSPLLSYGIFNYCMMLKFVEFTMNSRPLLCQVGIDLYPQNYLLAQINELKLDKMFEKVSLYPYTFHENLERNKFGTKGSRQPINVLVVKESERQREWFLEKRMMNWFKKTYTAHDIFLLVTTNEIKSEGTILSRIVSKSVITFEVEMGTPSKITSYAVILHDIPDKIWNFPLQLVVSKLASFYRIRVITWRNVAAFDELRLFNWRSINYKKRIIVLSCKTNPYSYVSTFIHASQLAYDRLVIAELVREVSFNMITLIVPNATFINAGAHKCVKLNSMSKSTELFDFISAGFQTINQSSYVHLPLQIINPLRAFKFLSCGMPLSKNVGFREFISIFEWNIWIIVIVFIVGVFPILFHSVERVNLAVRPENVRLTFKTFSTNDFMQSIIVLLEEGEAFSERQLKLPSLKWMLASLLIAGTVLSNAYKYDNVYNIIAPKKLIPYRQFDQLIQNNFTIYSMLLVEVRNFMFHSWPARHFRMESPHKITGIKTQRGGFRRISFYSEVMTLAQHIWGNKNVSNESRVLLSNTKLHPETVQILNETTKMRNNNYVALSQFLRKQWIIVSNVIRACNKSALILPELFASQMANKLRQEGHKYVYVGKDFLFHETLFLHLKGWTPVKSFWERVGTLETSGIWKWWNDVVGDANGRFSGRESSRASEIVVEKPSMTGNAEIIFQLFCISSTISVFCFLVELSLDTVGKAFFLCMVIWNLRLH
ncbi:unnamed protein product [Orchesella dallaii]|uniref:Uncharacterized protein n=1 Tax=Orchesella dallaii TaxID=48710 RepID=A0ABP1RZG0_9HEXA